MIRHPDGSVTFNLMESHTKTAFERLLDDGYGIEKAIEMLKASDYAMPVELEAYLMGPTS